MSERIPAGVFSVGVFIEEEMHARGWTLDDLVGRMGGQSSRERAIDYLDAKILLEIRDKNMSLDEETARKLGMAFGVAPEYWLNIDKAWRAA